MGCSYSAGSVSRRIGQSKAKNGAAEAWRLGELAGLSNATAAQAAREYSLMSPCSRWMQTISPTAGKSRRLQLKCPMRPRAVVLVEVLAQDTHQGRSPRTIANPDTRGVGYRAPAHRWRWREELRRTHR